MFTTFTRLRYRKQVNDHLVALFFPASAREIRCASRQDVDRWIGEGLSRRWTPATTASLAATTMFVRFVRESTDSAQRNQLLAFARDRAPKGLVAELEFLPSLRNGLSNELSPLELRINVINSMMASWLVRNKTIDIFVKSAFVTAAAQAIAGEDSSTIEGTLAGFVERIGTADQR